MKTNVAFCRALISLSHPVSIGAIVLLLFTDHIWRRVAPSWLTGKIGDFAWLIFAPFLLAVVPAWLLPRRERLVGSVAIIGVGLIFGLAKTVPAFHALTIKVLETLTGWPNVLRLDPTDLLALPALLIAWWIWQQSGDRSIRLPSRGWVLWPLAALATIGNSPAPLIGIRALETTDSIVYTQGFHSDDGGLTWLEGGREGLRSYAGRDAWQLTDPTNERVQYRFTPGLSIERSEDGGQTWRREFDLSGEEARLATTSSWGLFGGLGPFDAVLHPASGNLIVAMGLEGVLVRSPAGEWRWVSAGNFSVPQLKWFGQIITLLSGEIWLGAGLIGLIIALITLSLGLLGRARKRRLIDGVMAAITFLGWIGWVFTLLQFPPAMGGGNLFANVAAFTVPATVVLAAIVGVWYGSNLYRQNRRAFIALLVIAVIGALLYLLPYVLWSQGAIPFYRTATLFALALTAAMLIAGFFYMRRYNVSQVISTPSVQRGT
jgi:hypothetical protein